MCLGNVPLDLTIAITVSPLIMRKKLIKNAQIINERKTSHGDVLLAGERIEKIATSITGLKEKVMEIDASGLILIPGMIDAQVHFRDPGLTHKGDLTTESMAAVAGGSPHLWTCPIPFLMY